MSNTEHTTLVGDWFLAMTVSAKQGGGYLQTIFTRHAPSMQARIEAFDEEFEYLLKDSRWTAEYSRENAIRYLDEKVR
jgi:hypothetical protein